MNKPAVLLLTLALAAGSSTAALHAQMPAAAPPAKPAFELLGALILPSGLRVGSTVVGGLSGLSWNPDSGRFLMISDDKSEHGPARIYSAQVDIEGGHLAGFHIRATIPLRRADGSLFPPPPPNSRGENAPNAVDGEGVAYAADTRSVFWSSEGNYATGRAPSITEARPDGRMKRMLPSPAFAVTSADRTSGPRDNSDFEALCLSPDKRFLWVGMEFALLQDSDLPDDTRTSVTRITKLDRKTGSVVGQFAYPVGPRPGGAPTAPGVADGPGLVECAALPDGRLLTLERSYTPGRGNNSRVYLIDARGADDIAATPSIAGASPRPVAKTLALDVNTTGVLMDNYEGMAIGPVLPDGRRLLLMVSDDNFSPRQTTVVTAFALDLKALGPPPPVAP